MVSLPSRSSASGRSRWSTADSGFRLNFSGGSASDELASVPTQCQCGYTIYILTCMTWENPGQRFHTCPRRSDDDVGCGIWKWVDPTLANHYKSMMNDLLNTMEHLLDERGELQRALMVQDPELGLLKEECDAMSTCIEGEQLPVENHLLKKRHVFAVVAVLFAIFAFLIFK